MSCQLLLPSSVFPPWRIPLSNILDHLLCFSSTFYLPLPEYKLHKSRTFCVLSQVPRIVPNIQRRSAKNVLIKLMKGYMTSTIIWWQIHRGQEPKKCSCSQLLHTRPNGKYVYTSPLVCLLAELGPLWFLSQQKSSEGCRLWNPSAWVLGPALPPAGLVTLGNCTASVPGCLSIEQKSNLLMLIHPRAQSSVPFSFFLTLTILVILLGLMALNLIRMSIWRF